MNVAGDLSVTETPRIKRMITVFTSRRKADFGPLLVGVAQTIESNINT